MKVLIVLPDLEVGGGQHLAIDVAKRLLDKVKFKILILHEYRRTPISDLAENAGIECVYMNKKNGIDTNVIPKIRKELKEFRPDVVHAHLRVVPYLMWSTLGRRIRHKYYTVHSLANMDGRGALSRTLLWMAFHFFGFVPVAISDTCRKSISDVYNISIDKIPCVYNGIDKSVFYADKHDNKDIAAPVSFIATGRFAEPKNYPLMIEAFNEFHKLRPNSKLIILGDGSMRDIVEQKIDKYRLHDCVILKGIVNNPANYLNKADIYLMTSIWEGLPLSVLEAMAVGLPIITTKAGGVVDIVKDGVNGIVVECGDCEAIVQAMVRLYDSTELRQQYATQNLEDSKKYSMENCAENYYRLYAK